ncbi:hypothetical protein GKZ90_0018330 [Flavobacterium sp. MC2016-06]|jgi:hypothetical protein|uniref:hypothetical protein n=1 Tax=Flavobacterium sp. MC2016-06 TaxID=2676308 RepID=UPI0012BAB253|nr:hypothetical protein [Flavobacterium sp. MC2016-06]MBU3858422.1 hypothetical protein [Flavobacterium sp. MC2016-06]
MKFTKGQNVLYTTLSGKSYSATIVERKIDLRQGFVIRSYAFYYLINLNKNGINQNIICQENDLKALKISNSLNTNTDFSIYSF